MRTRTVQRDDRGEGARPVSVSKRTHEHEARPSRGLITHGYAALAYYTGGGSRMELHGEWNLAEGDVLVVPAGSPHRMLDAREHEFWGLSFCVPCFAAEGATSLLEPFERVRAGGSAVVHVPAPRRDHLEALFRELDELGRAPRGSSETLDAVERSLLTLILAEVDRAAGDAGAPTTNPGGVVAEALRFIERHCLRPLTLNEVAAAVGRSPAHLTSALTQATGRSAVQWIVRGRMAEARRLLLHSDERIDVVADRVGYADATHFIRMFRREHGSTPAAWRAANARHPRPSG